MYMFLMYLFFFLLCYIFMNLCHEWNTIYKTLVFDIKVKFSCYILKIFPFSLIVLYVLLNSAFCCVVLSKTYYWCSTVYLIQITDIIQIINIIIFSRFIILQMKQIFSWFSTNEIVRFAMVKLVHVKYLMQLAKHKHNSLKQ